MVYIRTTTSHPAAPRGPYVRSRVRRTNCTSSFSLTDARAARGGRCILLLCVSKRQDTVGWSRTNELAVHTDELAHTYTHALVPKRIRATTTVYGVALKT